MKFTCLSVFDSNVQFLSVTAPDGMILYTYGPTDKVHNNNWLLVACGMNDSMLPDFEDLLGEFVSLHSLGAPFVHFVDRCALWSMVAGSSDC